MYQAEAQIIRTFQLLIVAAFAATIWLRPASEAREARLGFLVMWWSEQPTLKVNQLDSNTIWNFPLQEAAKKSWWYRCKKNWTIKDLFALKLKENAINYNNSLDPLTWIFDLLRAAGSQALDLQQFGIASLKSYDPTTIKDVINKELLELSEAHHERYFKKL